MTHKEKVAYYLSDMQQRYLQSYNASPPWLRRFRQPKCNPYNFTPPLFRLLWRLGYEIPPPHFLNFFANLLVMGVPFGVFWSGSMWLLLWKGRIGAGAMLSVTLLAGGLFGLFMAAYYRLAARKLKLPSWEDYPTADI